MAKFYLQQSYHMANNICEVMFNKTKHDALPEDIKAILKYVPHAAHSDMLWKSMHRMSQDFIDLQTKDKVKVYRTPKPILDAQLKAWDTVIARHLRGQPAVRQGDRVAEGMGEAGDVLAQQRAGEPGERLRALLPEGAAGVRADQRVKAPR